ncbi:MAG: ATP-dependent zinc metalloprotease FtsH, partial [Actinomycetota bacterium]|nr:ATP-dependent zinc metalloprotease FtsH [Actinomycetota bacterium]
GGGGGAGAPRRTNFSDVAAAEEAIVELSEVRDYLADPAAFQRMGALPPKGVLLVGPPGCGKTLLARAVAGEADANFFSISGSEFVESLVGVGAARVRDLFSQARAQRPAIIFIDELDAVGRQRGAGLGGGHDEREQTLNELLVQMDGFSPSQGVAVLAATNRIDILDPALLRPGRFDRHVTIDRPDRDGRLAILRLHATGKRLEDADVDLPEVARQTPGFTGADLFNVLNEAALLAVREKAPAVGRSQLEEAVDRVVAGPKRRGMLLSAADKRRIAVHEAGHAVVAGALGKAGSIDKVSVIARGRGIGHLALVATESALPTREDMETMIAIAMAGGAAEKLVLGQPSVGSEADLERATNTARDMAGRYGMSDRLGPVRLLREHKEVFLGRDYLLTREVSQPTLERIDGEVRRIVEEQEVLARSVLEANAGALSALTDALLENETVQGAPLAALLDRVTARNSVADPR